MEALRIFTARKSTIPLVTADVTNHLQTHASHATVVQKYLESVVEAGGTHTTLSSTPASSSGGSTSHGMSSTHATTHSHQHHHASHYGSASGGWVGVGSSDVESNPHHTRLALEYLEAVLKCLAHGDKPSVIQPGREPGVGVLVMTLCVPTSDVVCMLCRPWGMPVIAC